MGKLLEEARSHYKTREQIEINKLNDYISDINDKSC